MSNRFQLDVKITCDELGVGEVNFSLESDGIAVAQSEPVEFTQWADPRAAVVAVLDALSEDFMEQCEAEAKAAAAFPGVRLDPQWARPATPIPASEFELDVERHDELVAEELPSNVVQLRPRA